MPEKPHKWGYKMFVLSGVSGFAYDIELYSGQQDNTVTEGETDCRASSNVVTRLNCTLTTTLTRLNCSYLWQQEEF